MDISITETDTKGTAVAKVGDEIAGEMTYSIAGQNQIIIDHTVVNDTYRGKGVGKQLFLKIVEIARDKAIKITPLCPFANAMFQKTPDIQDVLT